MRRVVGWFGTGIWLIVGSFCAFLFFDRYWIWRRCFNELGRCYDPESQQVFLEQAGLVWGSLALVSTAMAAICWRGLLANRRGSR